MAFIYPVIDHSVKLAFGAAIGSCSAGDDKNPGFLCPLSYSKDACG